MLKPRDAFRTITVLVVAIVLCLGLCACGSSRYSTGTESHSSSSAASSRSSGGFSYSDSQNSYRYSMPETYTDPRWPTTSPELLAIPEEQRWYNAWANVDTTCTIVGPVVDVYQATNEYGMPIFVSIGADYPAQDSVTLVIWGQDEETFDSTLTAIDHGNAWIAVTSYLGTYNGYLQFSTDNYVEWTYWTGVS